MWYFTAANAPGMPGDTTSAVLARGVTDVPRASVEPLARTLTYLLLFFAGCIITLVLTNIFRKVAVKYAFIDHPAERKFHKNPTPLMGGAAIFCGFWIVVIACLSVIFFLPVSIPENIKRYTAGILMRAPLVLCIFLGGLAISAVGLWDDKFVISPYRKLLFQFIVAIFTVLAGVRIRLFLPEPISWAISIIWILGITNAFNLLDNMDGVSAGVACMSSFLLFIVSIITGNYFISAFLAVFMGTLTGFLFFNFPPAKIFMGDCGSLFIGYIMAVTTTLGTYYKPDSPTLFPVVIPLLILAVPLFDIFSVMFIRIKQGKSIFNADKNHFSHRLVGMGMSVRTAVGFLYLITFCVGLPSLLLPLLPLSGVIIVFSQAIGIMVIIAILEYYGKTK